MNVWEEESKPEVICTRTVLAAVAIHLLAFSAFWIFAKLNFRTKEKVVPIELLVVVNENLNGEENEPPPLDNPPQERPQPKPRSKPEPMPREDPAPPVNEAVIKEKQKKPEKKEKPKDKPKEKEQQEKPKPKPDPEKAEAERKKAREERLKRMRESAKAVKPVKNVVKNAPSGNGKTTKKTLSDEEIKRLLGEGYKPGARNQLTADDRQRCVSLIRQAFYEQWDSPAWNPTLKEMVLKVRFDKNGRVVGYKLSSSSGDRKVDATVIAAAANVSRVSGLSQAFLEAEKFTVEVRFKVECR